MAGNVPRPHGGHGARGPESGSPAFPPSLSLLPHELRHLGQGGFTSLPRKKKKRVTQRLLRGGGDSVGEVLNLKRLGVCPHGSLKKRGHCYPGWGPGLS